MANKHKSKHKHRGETWVGLSPKVIPNKTKDKNKQIFDQKIKEYEER